MAETQHLVQFVDDEFNHLTPAEKWAKERETAETDFRKEEVDRTRPLEPEEQMMIDKICKLAQVGAPLPIVARMIGVSEESMMAYFGGEHGIDVRSLYEKRRAQGLANVHLALYELATKKKNFNAIKMILERQLPDTWAGLEQVDDTKLRFVIDQKEAAV